MVAILFFPDCRSVSHKGNIAESSNAAYTSELRSIEKIKHVSFVVNQTNKYQLSPLHRQM